MPEIQLVSGSEETRTFLSVVTVVTDIPALVSLDPPYELYIPQLYSDVACVDGKQVGVLNVVKKSSLAE